ncbi:intraflagellar transport protein 88 homolog [Clavelina lepadiformis]|uniref:intraflagellar transport protein 88 homolog n=1 Tax=Clavelina lepadiformis TaxID=159417 RepID=UPI004042DB6A
MSGLANLRLANEQEGDDIYSDFNNYNPMFDTNNMENDAGFMQAVKTSHGKRPPMTALRGVGAAGKSGAGFRGNLTSSLGRVPSDLDMGGRPVTSVTGAGFSSQKKGIIAGGSTFDPLNQASRGIAGVAPPLESLEEDTQEDKIKALERSIIDLIEQSAVANSCKDYVTATEKAKEAGKKERQLVRQREQAGLSEGINLELTYAVLVNLAVQYEANDMLSEALNMYQVIVKNKMFQHAGRLKVNMGNIYFKQGNMPKAIKLYRMALDQVPTTQKEIRIKIMQNIGAVFVKLGQYNDAVTSYEHIMSEKPDFQSGLNLILCYFALGDKEKMSKSFVKLLSVNLGIDDEDKYTISSDNPQESVYLDAIRNDSLRQLERKRKLIAERCILTAAKVISPAIENSFSEGFDWCVEQVKASPYHDLANDLEIHKALMYLKERDFNQAVSILKTFEKKDTQVKSQAATNLSFIYFLQGNRDQARRYADAAVKADRFNASSLTNKANCLFMDNDPDGAIALYREALDNDTSCYEALYNLGLVHKKLGNLNAALDCFLKLHNIVRTSSQVMFEIATIYENLEDWGQAIEWMMQCVGVVPTDASVLSRMAAICEHSDGGDQSQAFAYHVDSYRLFPADINTLEWLGAYYVESQFSEKAIKYFERAAVIQPNDVKWQLMVASCHRRSGNYQSAYDKYKHIHTKFPDNVECLKYLNRLSSDLGLTKEVQEYANKLRKAEKTQEARNQRAESAGKRRGLKPPDSADSSGGSRNNSGSGSARQRRVISDQVSDNERAKKNLDATYSDPLGPAAERPKTAARSRTVIDDFEDVEVDDNLLPD